MIITALRAENFLKYERLRLTDLPASGIIAISGRNESGKSTIGETICFVLFGRTFSIGELGLHKLIRWGATHCSVSLDFLVQDEAYRLMRYLDTDGGQHARLSLVDGDQPLAEGPQEVADALYDLLGFEYEEFIDTFYLAQREITKPHPHSYAVKSMAGIAVVEYVLDELETERRQAQAKVDDLREDAAVIQEELDELAFDQAHLPQLQEALTQVTERELKGERTLLVLKKAGLAYQESVPRIRRNQRARASTVLLMLLALAMALTGAAFWQLLGGGFSGGGPARLLRLLFADWSEFAQQALYVTLAFAGVFAVLLLRYWYAGFVINRMRRRSQRLAAVLDEVSTYARSKELDELLHQEPDPDEPESVEDEYPRVEFDEAACLNLRGKVVDGSASVEQILEGVADFADWLRYVIGVQRREMNLLNYEIGDESSRQAQFDALRQRMAPLRDRIDQQQALVDLRKEAVALLKAAGHHMSQRFNADLRDLAGYTLPLFTEGRYQHLQIDEALNVRVFSSDKRDYMDLEEISSGTQRQILLAVRLALAQQVTDNVVLDQQFAFLDEPFAFFDRERTRHSLKVLRNLSEDLRQVWVVAQEFPEDLPYDRQIRCRRDSDKLTDADLRVVERSA
jgi:DNA repair protein SbcC/Rad50